MRYSPFYIFLLLCSCASEPRDKVNGINKVQHSIAILPFAGTDKKMIREIQSGLEKRLHATIILLEEKPVPGSAFYKPRQRYVADSLLVFLKQSNAGHHGKILGITQKDISTHKNPHVNWGIMGLGYCPGEACVISSFRPIKKVKNRKHFINRMVILALHELGHTYSLPHCPNDPCIMKDAEGKMNLDNGETYCSNCSAFLKQSGILRGE
jgi:archaemetzincin